MSRQKTKSKVIPNFGKWVITRENLARGGQGRTHLVRNSSSESDKVTYVLKELRNPRNEKCFNRFQKEIEVLNTLKHRNILHIEDFDLNPTRPYLVTEYCKKGNLLNAELKNHSPTEILILFLEICEGVAFAHNNNIIHRDLKPGNILLIEDNRKSWHPVVGDFGICFLFSDKDKERLTQTREDVGPRHFMAPELANGRLENVSPACDVYSLGKLLYWLFARDSFDREEHREKEYDLVHKLQNPLLELLNSLLDKMLTPKPSERIQTVLEVIQEIERIIHYIEGNIAAVAINIQHIYDGQMSSNGATSMDTISMGKEVIKILKEGKEHIINGSLRDYFNTFIKELENFRIKETFQENIPFDEKVIENLDKILPIRNSLIDVLLSTFGYTDQVDLAIIKEFKDQLLSFCFPSKNIESYRRNDFDNFKFFTYELVLYLYACLFKLGRYQQAAYLLHFTYFLDIYNKFSTGNIRYFNYYVEILDEIRNNRLKSNRISITADMIQTRSNHPEIEFEQICETDFILYTVTALLYEDRDHLWYPRCVVYHRYGNFKFFERMISRQFFDNIKHLYKVDNDSELKQLVSNYYSRYEDRDPYGDHRFEIPSMKSTFDFQKICTVD